MTLTATKKNRAGLEYNGIEIIPETPEQEIERLHAQKGYSTAPKYFRINEDDNPVISAMVENYWAQETEDNDTTEYEEDRDAYMRGETEAQAEAREQAAADYEAAQEAEQSEYESMDEESSIDEADAQAQLEYEAEQRYLDEQDANAQMQAEQEEQAEEEYYP